MDFQNVNPLNVRLNMISGNLLPVTGDDAQFSILWRIYSVVIWLVSLLQIGGMISVLILEPIDKTLQNGNTVVMVVSVEVFILLTRMHMYRDVVSQLVQKLNDILRTEDETMRGIVQSTLKPLETPLEVYWLGGTGSIIIWCAMSLALVFKKKHFMYQDFGVMVAFSKQPFSRGVFLFGSFVVTIAGTYIFMKKVALDVYTINLVLLTTAQYRYTTTKLAALFRDVVPQRDEFPKKHYSSGDFLAKERMKSLCRHHSAVVQVTLILKKLLSANMSVIYFINVFRFCFIDILLINAILSMAIVEACMLSVYICSGLVQLYIICSCVQQLLDASTEITNKAFHEKWYQFAPSLKCTFISIIISNNLKCKLSSFEKFNLSLPSFMTILNQSYSVALLFLRMK